MAAGCGPPWKPGVVRLKGRGDPLGNEGESRQDDGSGGADKALRRFGGRSALYPGERQLYPVERSRSRGRDEPRSVVCSANLPANTGMAGTQTCLAAKASRTTEAPATERESVSMGERRQTGFAEAKTDSVRRRRRVIPGECAAYGNDAARAFSQQGAKPGFFSGNGVRIQSARAGSGLRWNRGSKTRKGREWNLEPDRKVSHGRPDGTGTELGKPGSGRKDGAVHRPSQPESTIRSGRCKEAAARGWSARAGPVFVLGQRIAGIVRRSGATSPGIRLVDIGSDQGIRGGI
jgi:hypothetical protein